MSFMYRRKSGPTRLLVVLLSRRSTFSKDAQEYVQRIDKRIILIGGKQLADLMIEHDVGVTVDTLFKLKKLGLDFFEPE